MIIAEHWCWCWLHSCLCQNRLVGYIFCCSNELYLVIYGNCPDRIKRRSTPMQIWDLYFLVYFQKKIFSQSNQINQVSLDLAIIFWTKLATTVGCLSSSSGLRFFINYLYDDHCSAVMLVLTSQLPVSNRLVGSLLKSGRGARRGRRRRQRAQRGPGRRWGGRRGRGKRSRRLQVERLRVRFIA